jgi:hypothetical protein
MKTTIEIADALLERAKAVARASNLTLRELTEEGLQLALDRRARAAAERRSIRFVSFGQPAQRPGPSVAWDDIRDMVYPAPSSLPEIPGES